MFSHSDPVVNRVLSTWAPRLVVQGVDYNDLAVAAERIVSWDDWLPVWSAIGAGHEERAERFAADGQQVSAAEAYGLASMAYHFGCNSSPADLEAYTAAHQRRVDTYRRAAPWLDPPAERHEVAFDTAILPGYLRLPPGVEDPPVVVIVSGLESTKEEHRTMEEVFLDRGMATFAFDGPGQGETWFDLGMIVEFERAVVAVLDHLKGVGSVDHDRIGLFGPSMGGYLSSRAAAVDDRIRAVAVSGASYDRWHMIEKLQNPFDFSRNAHAYRTRDIEELTEILRASTLQDLAKDITCPLLVVAGTADFVPMAHPERLAAEASGPTRLVVIEGGNHVCNNRPFLYRPLVGDFLAAELTAQS